VAVGAGMGWLIAYIEVPAMLATLGAMTLLAGINVVLTKGYTLSGFPPFLLGIGNAVLNLSPEFVRLQMEVYLFIAVIFWIFSYFMSYASLQLEKALGVGER